MSKALNFRAPDDDAAWLASYAAERDVAPSDLLRAALHSFREDSERSVPDVPVQAVRSQVGPDAELVAKARREIGEAIAARQSALNAAKYRAKR